jgi:hypothetical protein
MSSKFLDNSTLFFPPPHLVYRCHYSFDLHFRFNSYGKTEAAETSQILSVFQVYLYLFIFVKDIVDMKALFFTWGRFTYARFKVFLSKHKLEINCGTQIFKQLPY